MIDQIEHVRETLEQYKRHPTSDSMQTLLLLRLSENFLYFAECVEKIERRMALLESKGKEEQEEPEKVVEEKKPDESLITIREFCNSLIINGNMIIFPHNILGYIKENPQHFEGCFFQNKKGSPLKVYRKKLIGKLPHYQKASKILKQFLEEQQKNGQGDQENRERSQEDREGSEATRKSG